MTYRISDIPTHNTTPGGTSKIEIENPTGPTSEWTTLAEMLAANAPLPFRNKLLNGGFDVWQRGAGDSSSIAVAASTTAYTADRWYLTTGASEACTVSAQAALSVTSRKAGRVQRNSAQTGTTKLVFGYPLTTDECNQLRGKALALRFLASTGANWSPTSGTLAVDVYFGTGAQGKRGAGFTGETHPLSTSVNLSVSSGTITTSANSGATTVATNVTQGEIQFTWTPTGTAGAADFVDLDDVQLEPGITNTPYDYLPFGIVIGDCRRHFWKSFPYSTAPAQNAGLTGSLLAGGMGSSSETLAVYVKFPTPMVGTPAITTYNPSGATANFTNETANVASTSPDGTTISGTAAAVTVPGSIHLSADAGL